MKLTTAQEQARNEVITETKEQIAELERLLNPGYTVLEGNPWMLAATLPGKDGLSDLTVMYGRKPGSTEYGWISEAVVGNEFAGMIFFTPQRAKENIEKLTASIGEEHDLTAFRKVSRRDVWNDRLSRLNRTLAFMQKLSEQA